MNTVFDINQELNTSSPSLKNTSSSSEKADLSFRTIVEEVSEYIQSKYFDEGVNTDRRKKGLELHHQAIIGDSSAEATLTAEIEDYLRGKNKLSSKYPSYYKSLPHGIFNEIFRFGAFYKWNLFKDSSPSAKIQGDELWFKIDGKFQLQPERLRNKDHIKEIIRGLEVSNKGLKLNESNPEAEVEMKDGTRVTIVIPPRSLIPTITFRRFIVKDFSFEEFYRRNSIAFEDIELYKTMSKLQLNTIISGGVESAKTTLLKTIYATRDKTKVAINVESSPESYLKRDFPDRLVHDLYVRDSTIETVFRSILRIDHNYVIFQEVRGEEAEGAMKATERGSSGTLITYHITKPTQTPEQLAKHIVDAYPNRTIASEVIRVAEQLDAGMIMKSLEGDKGGQKRIADTYELVYDYETNDAWINYIVKYDKDTDSWTYNSDLSKGLLEKINEIDKELAKKFIEILSNREKEYPMLPENKIKYITFRG